MRDDPGEGGAAGCSRCSAEADDRADTVQGNMPVGVEKSWPTSPDELRWQGRRA